MKLLASDWLADTSKSTRHQLPSGRFTSEPVSEPVVTQDVPSGCSSARASQEQRFRSVAVLFELLLNCSLNCYNTFSLNTSVEPTQNEVVRIFINYLIKCRHSFGERSPCFSSLCWQTQLVHASRGALINKHGLYMYSAHFLKNGLRVRLALHAVSDQPYCLVLVQMSDVCAFTVHWKRAFLRI